MSKKEQLNSIFREVSNIIKKESFHEDKAFVVFLLREIFGLEESIVQEATEVGGSGDCGIDAFWIDESSINILQAKYYENIKVEEKEIDNFDNSLLYLDQPSTTLEGRCNKYFKNIVDDYLEAKEKKYNINLFFVTTSDYTNAAKKKLDILKRVDLGRMIDIWDGSELVKRWNESRQPSKPDVEISLNSKEYFISKGVAGVEAPYAVCTVSAVDLYQAYRHNRSSIFTQNLRYYLNKTGKINKEIKAIIEDVEQSKNFWYYNNGLTIICDDFELKSEKGGEKLEIKNFQIVNGAQTTRSIYESGKDRIGSVTVLARIIKTNGNDPLIQRIRDYNNRQNPTKPRDFVSHDTRQINLQNSFEQLGFFYEIKRGERNEYEQQKKIKTKRLDVIDNLTVAQAYLSFIGFPAQAKSQKNDILDPDKDFYGKIFTDERHVEELLFSYKCYEYVKNINKNLDKNRVKEQNEYLVHGSTHLVSFMGAIAKKIGLCKTDYLINNIQLLTQDFVLEKIYILANEILSDFYSDDIFHYKEVNKALVPSKHFKNSLQAEHYLEKIEKRLSKKNIPELKEILDVLLVKA